MFSGNLKRRGRERVNTCFLCVIHSVLPCVKLMILLLYFHKMSNL